MKIVNLVRYVDDTTLVARVRPEHRAYMDHLLDTGKLIAGGPYADDSGALFMYEVQSVDEAEAMVASDPYSQQGAIADYQLKSWTVVKADPALLPDAGTRVGGVQA